MTEDAQHLTLGPDGNMWFTERQVPAIGRITPNGEVTIFTAGLRAHSAPDSLAVGPDGNLWFADEGGLVGETGAIGRITTSGTITEFTSGLHSSARPDRIISGPDGDLWWTSYGLGGGIGKITTSGVITDLSGKLNQGLEPEDDRQPENLVVGPDKNIWFSNYSEDGSAIGRIVPSSDAVSEFPVADYGVPDGIVAGADGNVWFYDERNETVDRITPAGVITAFSTGAILNSEEEQQPTGIALGSDGNIWFSYNGKAYGTPPPAYVGKITPAGAVTTFTLPGQHAGSITSGPEGNLWFLDNGITRITAAGEISNFSASGRVVELAPGPDGDMWFDEGEGGEMIGKIGTAGSSSVTNPGTGSGSSTGTGVTSLPTSGSSAPKKPTPGVSKALSIAKTKIDLKMGVAQLPVSFSGPGRLVVSGKGIKELTEMIKKAGKLKIALKPTAKTLSILKSKGRVSVPVKLTFTPTGGKARTTATTLKLEG